MKFLWLTIAVKDLEESVKFYEEIVGLKLNNRFQAGPDLEIAFLGDGETKLELKCDKNDKVIDIGKDVAAGFEVDSLDEKMAFVKAKGLNIHSGPFEPNPQTKFFYVLDPNGLRVQFVQHS